MTRFRADLLLLLAALIWGTTFIAQKNLEGIGDFQFVAARFALSFIILLPLALFEKRRKRPTQSVSRISVVLLCLALTGGVIVQQIGIAHTSVTNAGFLTGLSVILTPFTAWFVMRQAPQWLVWPSWRSAACRLVS